MTSGLPNADPAFTAKLGAIARIAATDVGRNIQALVRPADFADAVLSILATETPHIAIVTGFFIPTATPPAPETDGLTGSVHLAAGLLNAGIAARIVTDAPCAAALRAAARPLGRDIPMNVCGTGHADIIAQREELTRVSPPITHLVAIERLGPNVTGRLLGQFGYDFTPYMAPFHELFVKPQRPAGWVTIGVGDGGNEIGMGKLPRALVAREVEHGERIHCTTPADHLIVCGVSNWAGPALLCGLAAAKPDLAERLLAFIDPATDHAMLKSCVHDGPAVDGSPEIIRMSIDGLSWEYHWDILSRMRAVATDRTG